MSSTSPDENVSVRIVKPSKPGYRKNINDNLGTSDDDESPDYDTVKIRKKGDKTQNIDSLKVKIDAILKMVSGDFSKSIEELLRLIQKLKQQLKDTKCAECSNTIKDVETKLEELKVNETNGNQVEYITKIIEEIQEIKPPNSTEKEETPNLNTEEEVKSPEKINQTMGVTISDKNDEKQDKEVEEVLNKVNDALQNDENKLKEELNKQLEILDSQTQELNITLPENQRAEIERLKSKLSKDIQIKNIFQNLEQKIKIITREINIIIQKLTTKNKSALLRKMLFPLSTLRLVLNNVKTYNTNLYNTNFMKTKEVKEFITKIIDFYQKLEKIDFTKETPKINLTYYNVVLNIIEDFNTFSSNNITKLGEQIKNNIITLDNIKNNNKKKNPNKRGGSIQRNKTNKIKKRTTKKRKGKMCKKNKTIKRKY